MMKATMDAHSLDGLLLEKIFMALFSFLNSRQQITCT
jgi:hypothetical protein